MRTVLVSILCLSVISVVAADQQNNKKKGQQQGGPSSGGQHHTNAAVKTHPQHTGPVTQGSTLHTHTNLNTSTVHQQHNLGAVQGNQHVTNAQLHNKNLQPVKFQSVHIHNSNTWVGPKYVVFRNYVPVWHTQAWWVANHSNFIFVFGAPYYWNAGFWYPAWGYYPNAMYYYEGPIYAGSPTVSPVDMVMRVQSALKQGEYYHGTVDGVLGEETQSALADYQEDHGLYVTSAIDEPTLESLGLS